MTTSTLPTSLWRLNDGTTCRRFRYSLDRVNLIRLVGIVFIVSFRADFEAINSRYRNVLYTVLP